MDMEDRVNPAMLVLAREFRRISQADLAEETRIPQAKISRIESGTAQPTPPESESLSAALGFPLPFFFQRAELYGIDKSVMYHRKKQSLPIKLLRKVHAEANIRRLHVETLLRAAAVEHRQQFPQYDLDDFPSAADAAAQAAAALRAAWVLPRGPISDLTTAIEDAGALVIHCDFETGRLDAVSQWVPGLPPLLFVNRSMPTDRMRFSLAHELGHLILHRRVTPDLETEANDFASNFLMPAEDIQDHLRDLTIEKLAALKPYWRVSMAALLERARSLGLIAPVRHRTLWMQMSKAGYKRREPRELDIPREQPTLLKSLIDFHREHLKYLPGDMADLLHMTVAEFQDTYLERPLLRVI